MRRHSKAAKNFFRKLRLSPEPHIVEVDLRRSFISKITLSLFLPITSHVFYDTLLSFGGAHQSVNPSLITFPPSADSVNLAGLLKRRTGHATFPNIILGGRSIGGTSDLELLDKDGELTKMFANLGIVEHGR